MPDVANAATRDRFMDKESTVSLFRRLEQLNGIGAALSWKTFWKPPRPSRALMGARFTA
jgi:hypothetical protein